MRSFSKRMEIIKMGVGLENLDWIKKLDWKFYLNIILWVIKVSCSSVECKRQTSASTLTCVITAVQQRFAMIVFSIRAKYTQL